LICPNDPENSFSYEPVFEQLGGTKYSGEFECQPSDSIFPEARPILDASEFLSSEQIFQLEQLWITNQYQSDISVQDIQVTDSIGDSPFIETTENSPLVDASPMGPFDWNDSDGQVDTDLFSDGFEISAHSQDFDESFDYSLLWDADTLG
jgi:hypothetical protein